ncbi:MAG: hypothetical protein PHY31_00475 [Smithellaceae bacterium]|nr:hypothetical protein [Smithellaceae bacterium]
MKDFKEIKAGSKPVQKLYVAVMLWFVGRAIQAAARIDDDVRKEFAALPEGFTFSLTVEPNGPAMIVGKADGRVKYLGWNPEGKKIDLKLRVKGIEQAMLMFTFQESTAMANARVRLVADGEVPFALAVIRVLDIVEVYLLPKLIAQLAVKRYPAWNFQRKYVGRARVYLRSLLGY